MRLLAHYFHRTKNEIYRQLIESCKFRLHNFTAFVNSLFKKCGISSEKPMDTVSLPSWESPAASFRCCRHGYPEN